MNLRVMHYYYVLLFEPILVSVIQTVLQLRVLLRASRPDDLIVNIFSVVRICTSCRDDPPPVPRPWGRP